MPSYLQVENISKSYGPKILFDRISFNINEGDKIALVAPNGSGKTTLLKILAGKDKSDSGGSIKFLKDIRIAFLEQDSAFNPDLSIADQIFTGEDEADLERKRILTDLGIDWTKPAGALSGGERKRVEISRLLASGAEFLIMDEPTNHLDLDAIEYLEARLKKSRCTLFMVTHDRYFLDRVCNTVMELDGGSLYIYKGDYENFLSKRDERISNWNSQTDKVRNILRRELEWIHATPCARSGKARYRKQAFEELKERAEQSYKSQQVTMEGIGNFSRLGTKIIDCKDLSFSFGDKRIVSHFTYNFQRFDRIGIVGDNGIGKSTFLNLLAGSDGDLGEGICPPSGIQRGESLKIGYYRQRGMFFNEDDTVLDIVPDTKLLRQFLFPQDMFSNKVSRLSGGEKRRLYLLTVLMQNPNMLILDEPTNDLDIVTLNVLEEYLLEYKGNLLVVTHDRHFLDRLVDHLLVFCGDGVIKDFIGGYSEYRSFIQDLKAEKKAVERSSGSHGQTNAGQTGFTSVKTKTDNGPRKLSFKEKRELEELEASLERLNKEKAELEALLSGGSADMNEISAASSRYQEVKDAIDTAEIRWLELSC